MDILFNYLVCNMNDTYHRWLAPWQSFISDILIPLFTWLITCYFARKTYCLERKLAKLQLFTIEIDITRSLIKESFWWKVEKEYYGYTINCKNPSHITWYINSIQLKLWWEPIAIYSWRWFEISSETPIKLEWLKNKEFKFNLEWAKKHYDLKNRQLYVVIKDSLWVEYKEIFRRKDL